MCIYTFLPLTATEWMWPCDNSSVTASSNIKKYICFFLMKKQTKHKIDFSRGNPNDSRGWNMTMGERSAAIIADSLGRQHDRRSSGRERGLWRTCEDRRDRCVWRWGRRLFFFKMSTELELQCPTGWLNQSSAHKWQEGRRWWFRVILSEPPCWSADGSVRCHLASCFLPRWRCPFICLFHQTILKILEFEFDWLWIRAVRVGMDMEMEDTKKGENSTGLTFRSQTHL